MAILKETLGEKLVTRHVAEEHASGDDKVRLDQLHGKLVVMVSSACGEEEEDSALFKRILCLISLLYFPLSSVSTSQFTGGVLRS